MNTKRECVIARSRFAFMEYITMFSGCNFVNFYIILMKY